MLEIPGYTILRSLGQGGMAQVYLTVQDSLRREVALKVLAPHLAQDPDAARRFLREARIAADLHHGHIVSIYDVGTHRDTPYMAMEYQPGGTVAPPGFVPKNLDEVLRIVRETASALDYAHGRGVVHRDVKPQNILRRIDGSCLLSDFGIAHAAGATTIVSQEGTSVGTPHYMSPEQLRGDPVDARSDLYSLGAVLYQLVTGSVPYGGSDGWAIGMQHMSAPIPRLPEHAAKLQPLLDTLLAKDPAHRPQSAQELIARIDELRGTTTPATAATTQKLAPAAARSGAHSKLAAAALLVALAVGAAWLWLPRRGADAPATQPSIAVLPFADLSHAKDQEYFSDGMSEELLNLLAKVPGLHVAGRTSAFAFKGKNEDLRSIGQKLGVATVLEGSVRRSGDRIRITTQLINVADGFHLWSESYDREMTDVFALQDEISAAVVEALKIKLLPGLEHAAKAHGTQNMEAYNAVLLGRQMQSRGSPDDTQRAIQSYEKAITLDPDYAAAHAALAISLISNVQFATDPQQAASARRRAADAIKRALELDPTSGEAYGARALLRMLADWDWSRAEADLREAVRLAPGDAAVVRRSAIGLAATGKLDEAIKALKHSNELDPLSAAGWGNLGYYLLNDGRYAEATEALNRALELSGGANVIANYNLGTSELLQGRPDAAIAWYQKIPESQYFRWTGIAMAEHQLGHAQQSRAALDALLALPQRPSVWIAAVYGFRGEPDQAFEWLGRAADEHNYYVRNVKYDRIIRRLSDDPRYDAFLRRVGLQ